MLDGSDETKQTTRRVRLFRYRVRIGYKDEDGDVRWLGGNEYTATKRADAIKQGMDECWDNRLDAASCRAVHLVRKLGPA